MSWLNPGKEYKKRIENVETRLENVETRLAYVENLLIQHKTRLDSQEILNEDMRNKVLRKIQTKKTTQQLDLTGLLPGQTTKLEGENIGNDIQK